MTLERDGMENLPAALDLAAFERTARGLFRPVGALPDWLKLENYALQEIDLAERFPLLELFFSDSASVFETGVPARMDSDVWEEDDGNGGSRYLQATALKLGNRSLAVLRLLSRERFTYQQLSHDYQLAEEKATRLALVAERATRAKSDFLAAMSHEIRTPLNAIIGLAEVLSDTALSQEQERCVRVLQRSGTSLLGLINDILDLSKVESGRIDLEVVALDLREVVARAMEVVEPRARSKGLELRQSIAASVPVKLLGDPNRLRQVIVNLLGNAVKFTEQGHVEVRVELDDGDARPGCLRIAVSDTGIGIPEDKLEWVFESFAQADSSTTRKYGGTGLGLTISQQLVQLMGGRIWVESQMSRGSTFFFTVKLGMHADPSTSTPSEGTEPRTPELEEEALRGLRILLVDDSEDNRFLIMSYLRQAECTIEIATNGQEAVDQVHRNRFDLVLMDVEMPVMDGHAATREIRRYEQERGMPATPVVALTAHALANMEEQIRESGFTAHLTKPVRQATLRAALAAYSRRSSSPREARAASAAGQPEEPLLEVDAGLKHLVSGYLDKRRQDIPVYRRALADQDFETVRVLAHNLKGTGAGYGFPTLTEIGGAIEQAALRRDAAEIAEGVDRLAAYIESLRVEE